ncbi:MAG: DUF192 domain-containing protein [Elusimicrobiota bacterium]|nr:DUF192 domain-containing protein [Elusimicrobiota bacterium]
MTAYNLTRGRVVASRVETADGFVSRGVGLLGRAGLPAGEALWLVPGQSIHTFFMRFAIDALFLDATLTVVKVMEDMRPWRVSPWVSEAHSVLELQGGALQGAVAVGDRLEMRTA